MGYGVRGSAEATETGQLMGLGGCWGSGEVGPSSSWCEGGQVSERRGKRANGRGTAAG